MLVSILLWLVAGLSVLALVIVACLVAATLWIAAKAERLVPASGNFVEIDGSRIHYVETARDGRSCSCTDLAPSFISSSTRCSTASAPVAG
ncbi:MULTISPECIES: hypothetical protein [unclassified Mesorhizobium]|uniref:hypothetical protein n=1 Tax=unclassified Mesorhizobium TaxID=325217 RepID=UPI001FD8D832|nr:hypothetical protein [Mesorhizobium sp. L2C067A000]